MEGIFGAPMNKVMILSIGLCMAMGCSTWKAAKAPVSGRLQGASIDAPEFYFASMNATYFGGQGRLKGELGLIISAPDKILLEVRGPGGNPISTFACNGRTISLFELEGPRFYSGPANPITMARLLPLPVEPEIAVSLLRGRLPMPSDSASYQTKGQAQQLSGMHPTLGTIVVTRYSPEHWTWELPDESLHLTLKKPTEAGLFRDILIRSKNEEVRLRLSELDASGTAPETQLFTLEPPPGVTVQPL